MIKIKVPATSANLGPGFDCLGLAFNLYNVFSFELCKTFCFSGFDEAYANDNNLVKTSYEAVFKYLNKEVIPVKITMDYLNVPTSRGLGSSATCIVAGVLAAKYFLNDEIDILTCFNIASNIEGHPDNVCPAMFGGLISSYKTDTYKYVKYDVSSELIFNVLVPSFKLNTHVARSVLPKSLEYKDIIFNMARVSNIPYAFSSGNICLIKELLNDKLHEPYRMSLIKDSSLIKKIAHDNDYSFSISGAGPSLLVISKNKITNEFEDFSDWRLLNLEVCNSGAIVEVI